MNSDWALSSAACSKPRSPPYGGRSGVARARGNGTSLRYVPYYERVLSSMKIKLIACEIAFRELCLCAAQARNVVDVQFLPKGLHDIPTKDMVARLQAEVDRANEGGYEAIVLAYGLCNNGTIGLSSPRVPLIIPRAHDCITFFLGARQRYRQHFDNNPGTFYRSPGWFERNFANVDGTVMEKLGLNKTYEEYVAKYGEENAKFIMETMGNPLKNYKQITYINTSVAGALDYERQAREEAQKKGWTFERLEGDTRLLQRLLDGDWGADDFLVLKPGEKLAPSNNEDIFVVR
ncbi:MAG: DUF1638 domain-containing protein [Planctomycetes bacterium]|nr:DUF1638 domain-containing protein [Planctomycetota bacterium]